MDTLMLVAFTMGGERDAEPDRPRPIVVVNPANDAGFVNAIDAYLLGGSRHAGELEAALRTRYPRAVVRPRELAGERVKVWYAFREGQVERDLSEGGGGDTGVN